MGHLQVTKRSQLFAMMIGMVMTSPAASEAADV